MLVPPVRTAFAPDGEFAGWAFYPQDVFETQSGPFYFRVEAGGGVRCAFRVAGRHLNGGGTVHGGCLMTFADYCLFAIGHAALAETRGVTVSMNSEFVGPARDGDLVEGTGEIVKAGRSLLFMRGVLAVGAEPVLIFSGVVKKLGPRP
jgi:uncharacterized protein (TIGR00369 family)